MYYGVEDVGVSHEDEAVMFSLPFDEVIQESHTMTLLHMKT
jgi:hypothetical protein